MTKTRSIKPAMRSARSLQKETAHQGIYFLGIVLAAALVLGVPFFVRIMAHEPLILGSETAKTLALVRHANFSGLLIQDPFLGTSVGSSPWLRLLALCGLSDDTLIWLPWTLGILTVLILYRALLRVYPTKKAALAIAFVLINPVFIGTFTELSSWTFLAFIFTCAASTMLAGKETWTGLLLAIMIIEDPFSGTFAAATIILLMQIMRVQTGKGRAGARTQGKIDKDIRKASWGMVIALTALAIVSFLVQSLSPVILETPFNSISDLGVTYGVPATLVLLLLTGLVATWNRELKGQSEVYAASLTILVAFQFVWLPARILLPGLVGMVAAEGILFLGVRTWSYPAMKQFTILLIICTFFISLSTFYSVFDTQQPSQQMALALSSLPAQLMQHGAASTGGGDGISPTGAILARPEIGAFVEYYAGLPVVADLYSQQRSFSKEQWKIGEEALLSRNPEQTRELLQNLKVHTILIDPVLETDLEGRGQGILFLIGFTQEFTQLNLDKNYRLYALQPVATGTLQSTS